MERDKLSESTIIWALEMEGLPPSPDNITLVRKSNIAIPKAIAEGKTPGQVVQEQQIEYFKVLHQN